MCGCGTRRLRLSQVVLKSESGNPRLISVSCIDVIKTESCVLCGSRDRGSQPCVGVRAPELSLPSAGFTWICLKNLAWKLPFPDAPLWERLEGSPPGEGGADTGRPLLPVRPQFAHLSEHAGGKAGLSR